MNAILAFLVYIIVYAAIVVFTLGVPVSLMTAIVVLTLRWMGVAI